MKVLVVSTMVNLRIKLRELLLSLEHEVMTIASGTEALSLLESYGAQIVMTDSRKSGENEISGIDLIRQMRTKGKYVPIIATTVVKLPPSESENVIEAGASAILRWPFDEEVLETMINKITKVLVPS